MVKRVAACAWTCLFAVQLAQAQPASTLDAAKLAATLGPGIELVQRMDADLNRDGETDTAYVGRGRDGYLVGVVLAYRSEGTHVHDDLKPLLLPDPASDPPVLDRKDDVLGVRHAGIGGTKAWYRYRYDPYEHEMILVGLDAERTGRARQGHDGIRLRWDLLTGAHVVEHGKHAPDDAADAYGPGKRTVRKPRPIWMVDTPDVDALLDSEIVLAGEGRD